MEQIDYTINYRYFILSGLTVYQYKLKLFINIKYYFLFNYYFY